MNALIFATLLEGATRVGVSAAASVWLFLVVVEWLADRFAGWLRHGWAGLLVRSAYARAGSQNGQVG